MSRWGLPIEPRKCEICGRDIPGGTRILYCQEDRKEVRRKTFRESKRRNYIKTKVRLALS